MNQNQIDKQLEQINQGLNLTTKSLAQIGKAARVSGQSFRQITKQITKVGLQIEILEEKLKREQLKDKDFNKSI